MSRNQVGSAVEQHWRHPQALPWQAQPQRHRGDAQPRLEPEEDVWEGRGVLHLNGTWTHAKRVLGGKHPAEAGWWKVEAFLFALNHLSRLLTLGQHVENWPLHWQWLWPWENTDTVCPQVQITRLYRHKHTFNLDRHWSPTKCGNMKICPMASNEAGGKFHRNTTFASSPLQW